MLLLCGQMQLIVSAQQAVLYSCLAIVEITCCLCVQACVESVMGCGTVHPCMSACLACKCIVLHKITDALVAHLLVLLQPQEQLGEQDAAITAEMSKRLEPLWAALSATITQIEAKLPAHVDSSSEATSAAASILPPGAAQAS